MKVTSDFDLKNDTMRLTKSTSNLKSIKNDDWIEAALERFGLYVSSQWDSLETFFNEYNNRTDKLKIEDFKKFSKDHFHCFEGFNFSEDELVVIYSAIDAHKKSYVTFEDIQNKIGIYNFYRKMHHDIKNFVRFSFKTGVEAFKYFSTESSSNVNSLKDTQKLSNYSLSKKEIFDGINSLFPKKYTTNQALNYLTKFFKDPERIEFSEFNYIYFDKAQKNEYLSSKSVRNSQAIKPRATSAHQQLSTPYDKDPLEKVKRLLKASKFDMTSFFKMYEVISNGWLNQNEFANMLKKMNLGLTLLEIEKIMSRVSRSSENLLNLKEFIAFMTNT